MNQEYSIVDHLMWVDHVDKLHMVGVLHDYLLPWVDLHIVLKHVLELVHKIALRMDVVMAYDTHEGVVQLENHNQENLEIQHCIHSPSASHP